MGFTDAQRRAVGGVEFAAEEAVYIGVDPDFILEYIESAVRSAAADYEADEGKPPKDRP